jgi:DNA (cytosine-5)-methyltransferase 1
MAKPTFYEFFAGGGMARAGLGEGWQCLFANDFDPKKAASYRANWEKTDVDPRVMQVGDIHGIKTADLPGHADLAWASFPCQDLSLAGNGKGLNGERSGAFWGFWEAIHGLKQEKRAPQALVLENVVGALTSNKGKDFTELCRALKLLGYRYGAMVIDAALFLPQSRPRLFIVALKKGSSLPGNLSGPTPQPDWTSVALNRVWQTLPPDLKADWIWWRLSAPDGPVKRLAEIIEEIPISVEWNTLPETKRLISMMSQTNLAKLKSAKAAGKRVIGTIYKRTREENGERLQRAELRFDNIAGCLRTPGGGSSRQIIIEVEGEKVRTRLLSTREAARLMGLDDAYLLPAKYNEAYHLMGDGLAVPVVRHLATNLLAGLLHQSGSALMAAE